MDILGTLNLPKYFKNAHFSAETWRYSIAIQTKKQEPNTIKPVKYT